MTSQPARRLLPSWCLAGATGVRAWRLLNVMTSGISHGSNFYRITVAANSGSSAGAASLSALAAHVALHGREQPGKPTIRRLPCILTLRTELLVEAV